MFPKLTPSRRHNRRIVICCIGLAIASANTRAANGGAIDFARDIQPLLASRCYDCHGAEKAKGGLRLTSRADALKGGESGEPVIVAGASAKSAIIQRITSTDETEMMPQKSDPLPAAEVALLTRWIDEGAVWPDDLKHWAYVKPARPDLPALRNPDARPRNAIDHFVFARLEQEGLKPAPETDKARWLRRASLDLVGLPPGPKDLADFLADRSEAAYERVVDRLLASPHYGERWARPWLDLARYADSHGFQRDDLRDIWPYRDWVIRALNDDMPFDRFTIWQIAGDLLPETRDANGNIQNFDPLIATGFHRTAPVNVEAGTDQEEGRVNQVFERVNTTGAVWLGTTLECAQCHNHKYDPITQKEYYQFFAFFNQTPRETDFTTPRAMAALKFTGPFLELPDPTLEQQRQQLQARIADMDQQIAAAAQRARADLEAWAEATAKSLDRAAQVHPLPIADFASLAGSVHTVLPDNSVLLVDEAPDRDVYVVTLQTTLTDITGFKLETLTHPSLPGMGPGRSDPARPNFVLNKVLLSATRPGDAEKPVKFVRASASYSQPQFSVETLLTPNDDSRRGWAIAPQFHRDHWVVLETAEPIGSADGLTLKFTLEQNSNAGRTIGRLRLSALTGRNNAPALPADIAEILRTPRTHRTAEQLVKLEEHFVAQDKTIAELKLAKAKLLVDLSRVKGPQTLVMQELEQPRATRVFNRGNFLEPSEPVEPGTPAVLHALRTASAARGAAAAGESLAAAPATAPRLTRLDLAQWLVDPENPLVARVTVNRWWAEFFGRGLVATPEDFGIKGELPSHPELLDWLAVEFMERGWSMKHIHKLIVLSATYRQSARITPELLVRDDQNKLYARGPRFRLDAETIRDNALAAAGLLSLKMGGPPVRPYQPPGLWENKVGGDRVTYEVSKGEDAWRRGIYTVWKRSSPYPSFMNFDATSRTACTIRRSRSNTPLQALTLLNDPVYVEAAAALAKRVQSECANTSDSERLIYAFRLCVARDPSRAELAALQQLLDAQRAAHNSEAAGWRAVATALLNLDEMITK